MRACVRACVRVCVAQILGGQMGSCSDPWVWEEADCTGAANGAQRQWLSADINFDWFGGAMQAPPPHPRAARARERVVPAGMGRRTDGTLRRRARTCEGKNRHGRASGGEGGGDAAVLSESR